MTRLVLPGARWGSVTVPASKSQAHRLLVLSALGEGETLIRCDGISDDIAATVRCLRAIGADIAETAEGLRVRPRTAPAGAPRLAAGPRENKNAVRANPTRQQKKRICMHTDRAGPQNV